jgi:hypothetical protein
VTHCLRVHAFYVYVVSHQVLTLAEVEANFGDRVSSMVQETSSVNKQRFQGLLAKATTATTALGYLGATIPATGAAASAAVLAMCSTAPVPVPVRSAALALRSSAAHSEGNDSGAASGSSAADGEQSSAAAAVVVVDTSAAADISTAVGDGNIVTVSLATESVAGAARAPMLSKPAVKVSTTYC